MSTATMSAMTGEDHVLETARLVLRKLSLSDYADLCDILQDSETMYAYEGAFSNEEVLQWLDRQLQRYASDGFGLWAVVSKATGDFLGQCGLTMQDCDGERVVEIGYLFKRRYWGRGYAAEAAVGCKEYAFNVLGVSEVYSIIRDSNLPSQRVAQRNGMSPVKSFVKHYRGLDMPHVVYMVRNR